MGDNLVEDTLTWFETYTKLTGFWVFSINDLGLSQVDLNKFIE